MGELPEPRVLDPGGERAIRLMFEYDGDNVRLLSRQQVDMMVPLSDPVQAQEGARGSWLELRDVDGAALFRRVLAGVIIRDVEGVSDAPGSPMTRRPVEHPRGVLVVLVPDLEDARTVALWDSLPGQDGVQEVAREVVTMPLRDDGDSR